MIETFIFALYGALSTPYKFLTHSQKVVKSVGYTFVQPSSSVLRPQKVGLLFILIVLLMISFLSLAQEQITVTYTESNANILNPERGFRFNGDISPESNFATYYEALGITLVHSYVRLDDYRNQDLSQAFLDDLEAGFTNMRNSGIKTVLRFSYNFGPYPDSEPDASKAQLLKHIEQLRPILQNNADVIAWMQAGFIGAWGEWHTSTNGLDNLKDKQEILFTLLDALPETRMIQVRYPSDIIDMFPEVLSGEQAFTQTQQARVGFHNDCFLSSDTDVGTYEKSGEFTIERDQNYLSELTRFTPTGGETCAPNPPRSDCEITLQEMELLHFTELNQSYHPQIIRAWKRQGCFEEIQNRLGYRFVLQSSELNSHVAPGGILNITVKLENQGFASLINPRDLIVVLDGAERHEIKLPLDPRIWESGEHSFSVSLQLPSNLAEGDYSLALWLPDAYETLRDNPRYAVRFANDEVWNEDKGYNLLASITIDSSIGGAIQDNVETLELILLESERSTQSTNSQQSTNPTLTNSETVNATPSNAQKRRPIENGPELIATTLTELPKLDGDLSEWTDKPCTTVDSQEQISFGDANTWTDANDLSAKVCYAWDKNNFYVAIDVTDDLIVQKNQGSNLWQGDHVELWFDTKLQEDFDVSEANDDDFQLGFSPGNFADVPADIFIWQPQVPRSIYEGVIEYAVQQTEQGYQAEMRIPASLLVGLELQSGNFIGATFDPSDTDTPDSSEQEMMLSTAPKTQWGVPTLWNNLVLQGEATVSAISSVHKASEAVISERTLSSLQDLKASNVPSDVTAIIGYSFDPGDVSKQITDETLVAARGIVQKAAAEGALWLDADMGITNFSRAFYYDPALSYYPLANAIIEEAHKAGIKVFFYFSGSEIETPNYEQDQAISVEHVNPDWLQVDQHGQPMAFAPGEVEAFWLDETTADNWANPLSPGFREAIMVRAEKIAELGADGIFVDVPYYFNFDNRLADFSQYSAKAFKEATGLHLPEKLDNDDSYQQWLDWRQTVWRDYFAEMNQRVKAKNPNTLIIPEEWPGASTDGTLVTGYDTAVSDIAIDIATHEYGHKQDQGGAIAYGLYDWQYTREVYKQYQAMNRTNWSLCYATNAPDSKALAAITYAHQLSFWETKAPTMLDESTGQAWREELLAWIKTNQHVYNSAAPIAEVVLVYSSRSRNQTYGESIQSLMQMQQILDVAGIPYVIITEQNIARIHDFAYAVFPGVTYTLDTVQTEVSKYKGKLIITDEALSQDAFGKNELTPPVTSVTIQEAVAAITSIPIKVEGPKGLFVELFRKDDAIQVRIFDPNLNDDFEATSKTITLTFKWSGDLNITALEFMGETVTLEPTQDGDTVTVDVPVELFTTVTLE